MTEKIDNLEEQLLNGTEEKKKGIQLPPFLQKLRDQLQEVFKKGSKYNTKVSDKHQFIVSLSIF